MEIHMEMFYVHMSNIRDYAVPSIIFFRRERENETEEIY